MRAEGSRSEPGVQRSRAAVRVLRYEKRRGDLLVGCFCRLASSSVADSVAWYRDSVRCSIYAGRRLGMRSGHCVGISDEAYLQAACN